MALFACSDTNALTRTNTTVALFRALAPIRPLRPACLFLIARVTHAKLLPCFGTIVLNAFGVEHTIRFAVTHAFCPFVNALGLATAAKKSRRKEFRFHVNVIATLITVPAAVNGTLNLDLFALS